MNAKTEGVDIAYKLLLLGESNVGKTSIILRYIENLFKIIIYKLFKNIKIK